MTPSSRMKFNQLQQSHQSSLTEMRNDQNNTLLNSNIFSNASSEMEIIKKVGPTPTDDNMLGQSIEESDFLRQSESQMRNGTSQPSSINEAGSNPGSTSNHSGSEEHKRETSTNFEEVALETSEMQFQQEEPEEKPHL